MIKDIDALSKQYKPLILATFKKYNTFLSNAESKKELFQAIQEIFAKLVLEYDERRKVDFPFYIKRMLELRTWHYVSKQTHWQKYEFPSELGSKDSSANTKFEDMIETRRGHSISQYNDEDKESIEDLLNAMSWNDDFKIGKKQKNLFIGILRDHKTLEQLAKEEGCKISTLHTRLHFLIEKLKDETRKQKEEEQENDNEDQTEEKENS